MPTVRSMSGSQKAEVFTPAQLVLAIGPAGRCLPTGAASTTCRPTAVPGRSLCARGAATGRALPSRPGSRRRCDAVETAATNRRATSSSDQLATTSGRFRRTTPANVTSASKPLSNRATLAAPPSWRSSRSTRSTGTGASGLIRSASPRCTHQEGDHRRREGKASHRFRRRSRGSGSQAKHAAPTVAIDPPRGSRFASRSPTRSASRDHSRG